MISPHSVVTLAATNLCQWFNMTLAPSPSPTPGRFVDALPFWASLTLIPFWLLAASLGGWWLLIIPLSSWGLYSVLDVFTGLYEENSDPQTPDEQLFWYRLITLVWFPIQFVVIFASIWWALGPSGFSTVERVGFLMGVGVLSGTIGVNYSHELIHQKNRLERLLGDLLLASVLNSHFRSEHLLVHHRYVGTPRDPVTARYNEGFHAYYARVLMSTPPSAFGAEREKLARKDLSWWHATNPFWLYWGLQGGFLLLAFAVGGWAGVGLFVVQALTARWQLELVNYIEHYGLVRLHLGNGKYEHVRPHHSWNSAHRASNWLLINLQRHSDHHYKPDRRFPLLQTYTPEEAPALPYGYPVMTLAALIPPVWFRWMNPKVRAWRKHHYPDVTDWSAYKAGTNPMPR